MLNNNLIIQHIYTELDRLGLRQQREKFYLDDAGHRGFSIDVGSSLGEVLIRITENGIQIERIPITKTGQVRPALEVVALAVAHTKAELRVNPDAGEVTT